MARCSLADVAVVGVSESQTCGVRDHATLLAAALGEEDVACTMHWLSRRERSLGGCRAEFRAWTQALAGELERERPDAIVLHYSVFSCSYRGLPLFAGPVRSALRTTGIPLITILHEPAYPWRLGGLHGKVWALTQRVALIGLMRDSAAVLVTAPFRAEWLTSRPWFARRPLALAPVFSNLPPPTVQPSSTGLPVDARASSGTPPPTIAPAASADGDGLQPRESNHLIGLFGYAYEGAARQLVLDAVRMLVDRGLHARLELLGSPGSGVPLADVWLADARQRGIEDVVSFSGVLPAQELSNALAACEVLLHAEASGPTSRKGTLAASLASGRPVVALDGPLRWSELIDAEAALVVQPNASALADALAGLLADETAREVLGARGAAFAQRAMSVERTAKTVARLLEDHVSSAPPVSDPSLDDGRELRSARGV